MNSSGFTDFGFSMQQFYLGQMLGNLCNSMHNLFYGISDVEKWIEEKKDLDQAQIEQARRQLEQEISTMREEQRKNIQHMREMSKQAYENQRKKEEFVSFLNNWKKLYNCAIDSVLSAQYARLENADKKFRLTVMVLRSKELDNISTNKFDNEKEYRIFCERIKEILPSEHFYKDYLNISKGTSHGLVTDTMCIHYMMQGMPTLIIYPRIDGKNIALDCAMWGYRPGTENIFFKRNAFCFEYNGNQTELVDGIVTLSSMANDSSRLLVVGEHPFLTKKCAAHQDHPTVLAFNKQLAKSLTNPIAKILVY